MESKFTDFKLVWPDYKDTPIGMIEEIAEGCSGLLKTLFNIESEFEVTSEGIIFTIESAALLPLTFVRNGKTD